MNSDVIRRLAEIEHLSRELALKMRQQRSEFGLTLPRAGSAIGAPGSASAIFGPGADGTSGMLTMQARAAGLL